MSNMSPAAKGLAIAAGIVVVLGAGAILVRESGVLDRSAGAAADAPAPGTIPAGTWTVGKGIEPGTYTVEKPLAAGSRCYWAIYKAGTNQNDIVSNDVNVVGRPTITLVVGHEFRSHDCGTWVKQ